MKLFVPESGAAFFPILFSKSPTHFRDIFAGVMRRSLGTKILKIPLPQLFLFSQTLLLHRRQKKTAQRLKIKTHLFNKRAAIAVSFFRNLLTVRLMSA